MARKELKAIRQLQRVYRGAKARRMITAATAYDRWLQTQAPLWVRVQSSWRGVFIRNHDQDVRSALHDLRKCRVQEMRIA
eukprot:CAMPEP_0185788288 /NCGR_PEP_ID=MMETSP1174-20130828/145336_1 /TAXON_ID=35687 /ORGANISM="Dictyocha speculum, Strain CCMP1381" /LENGTH=79 /DNA_ID=CAMNT_0028481903 /DNA_START=8 /DNA_END=244 /DNA_ORIENTATION=+